MKIWIIILSIVFILLFVVRTFLANYIMNDKTERVKYYFLDGATPLGTWHGIIYILEKLVGFADIILIIITVVEKFL